MNENRSRDVTTWRFLYHAARAISARLDTREVLQHLMSLTHDYFKPDAVSVAEIEEDGSLHFCAASGGSAGDITGLRLPPGQGIVGWVATHGEPLWVPDVRADPRFYSGVDEDTGFHTTAILAMPVRHGETTLAVLELVNPTSETDLEEAVQIMEALASLASAAIQNANLFEQVRQAEARYQSFFELNLNPVIILDVTGQPVEINAAARRLFEIAPGEGHTLALSRLGLEEDELQELNEQLYDDEVVTWEYELPGPDPRILEVSLSCIAEHALYKSLASGAYQWVGHDITDRVALEQTRQQLSNMIVHDLRVPLGSILNSIELVLTAWQQKDLTVPVEQVLQIALRSAHRMDRLISDILDTARMQSKEKALSLSEIDVFELLGEAVDVVASSAQRRNHKILRHLPSHLPPLSGDADLLRRVLINILGNAVKYTPEGGRITVSVQSNEDNFHFAISDDGPGIPPEDQAHIFELFFRGRAQRVKGAGIGLAFCKLAVEAHGGEIWLESDVDEGAHFYFTIPRNHLPEGAS